MSTAELAERQHDEVNSIASIYGDIFKDVTSTKKVWNREPSPHFQISLVSDDNRDRPAVSVVLDIEFTATYPLSPPVVRLLEPKNLLGARVQALEARVHAIIREYPEQEVAFTIISDLKDMLDEFQQTTEKVLSLDEERELRMRAQRLALENNEKQQAAKIAAERHAQEAEATRQIATLDDSAYEAEAEVEAPLPASTGYDYFVFDKTMTAEVPGTRQRLPFRAVSGFITSNKRDLLSGVATRQYIVKPYLGDRARGRRGAELAYQLTEIELCDRHWATEAGKRELQELERQLSAVTGLAHDNIVRLVGFQIDKTAEVPGWHLRVLSEFASASETLGDLLPTAEYVNWGMARSWLIQILPALEYLHSNGVVHGAICPVSVAVHEVELEHVSDHGPDDGPRTTRIVKIGHPGYGARLVAMMAAHPNPGERVDPVDDVPPAWKAPETKRETKTDIWDLGVLFIRVMLSYQVLETFATPDDFFSGFDPSQYPGVENDARLVYDLLCKMLTFKPAKRPSALELNAVQFLRDGPTMLEPAKAVTKRKWSHSPNDDSELDSPVVELPKGGRYQRDFEEVGRLGKGGFGEVVKARSRIEGTFYAIKKIRHKAHRLESLLSEVLSLARLNHQYIVRYYGAWFEDDAPGGSAIESSDDDSDESDTTEEYDSQFTTSMVSRDASFQVDYLHSFDPDIEFGYSSDESDVFEFARSDGSTSMALSASEEPSTAASDSTHVVRREPVRQPVTRSILYIQMEFCENNTLLDLIQQGLPQNPGEYWRLFRQLLEAVSYIHREGFIHRDLKPMNIFIDKMNNIKVGDFGLAKSAQRAASSGISRNNQVEESQSGELSTVVGTVFYSAPEVATGDYDAKVDMYSLGIIFFEMCFPMATGMERAHILNDLRLKEIKFPQGFSDRRQANEKRVIRRLLDHSPKSRPEASELLQSGWIPVEHQDVVIKEALKSLADPASPWQGQVRETLFHHPYSLAKDLMFDRGSATSATAADYLGFSHLVDELARVFSTHGAVPDYDMSTVSPRAPPKWQPPDASGVYEILDKSGAVLTLPYDLTLPLARHFGRTGSPVPKFFRHQFVYRDNGSVRGSGPSRYSTMSFDICGSDHHTAQDSLFQDAECLKVLDDVANTVPCFAATNTKVVVLVNHYTLLQAVLTFAFGHAGLEDKLDGVMGVLSQLGIDASVDDVKRVLRDDFAVPHTVVHDLVDNFNFTVDLETARFKLRKAMVDSPQLLKVERAMGYLMDVAKVAKRLGVHTPVFLNPLSNYNAKYYPGGIMFQMVFRVEKARRFNRVATGGRYDGLISSLSSRDINKLHTPYAVGFSLSTHLVHLLMKAKSSGKPKHQQTQQTLQKWRGSRCQVLVNVTSDAAIIDSSLDILKYLWRAGISADCYRSVSSEDLNDRARADGAEVIVTIRQPRSTRRRHLHHANPSSRGFKPLRVRHLASLKDTDVDYEDIAPFLSAELGGPTGGSNTSDSEPTRPPLSSFESASSLSEAQMQPCGTLELNPKVLVIENMAPRGRKNRKDKNEAESDTKLAANDFLRALAAAPVVSVTLRDEVMDMVASTSISSEDEWVRKVIYSARDLPKSYAMNIYNTLVKEKAKGHQSMMMVSQRTQKTVVVDLTRGA
ncbi:eIF-2-alpha kinase Gcn2p [Diutina catenulata]